MRIQKNGWDVVYKKAIQPNGTLLFPERLTEDFLDKARRTMGSYIFANQYQNEIIPDGEQTFKKEWLRYYDKLPDLTYTFCFIDPAISEASTSDFTGVSVVTVDSSRNWFVRLSQRYKFNPSQLIELIFRLYDQFQPQSIGVEEVAFQKAITHFTFEEMRRRNKYIPVSGVKIGTERTKEQRILSLVPRFEFGTLFLSNACKDLELELAQFPRGSSDDTLDSLSGINEIVYYPTEKREQDVQPHNPNSPEYEKWYIRQLTKRASEEF